MPYAMLGIVADCSPLPIAVFEASRLIVANKALRMLVTEQAIEGVQIGAGNCPGRRVILPTREGGALALDVIDVPDSTDRWILRGEEPVRRAGLAEHRPAFVPEPVEGLTLLGMHLVRAAQRAQEQERAVALLFLELLGLERLAVEEGQDVADKALAQLDARLHGNLRAADQMLAQNDGRRAVVAVVSDGDGAAVLAQRISALFARPLVLDGVERLFGIRIGLAYATGPDMSGLEQVARDALRQAARSKRPFLAIAGPCVA